MAIECSGRNDVKTETVVCASGEGSILDTEGMLEKDVMSLDSPGPIGKPDVGRIVGRDVWSPFFGRCSFIKAGYQTVVLTIGSTDQDDVEVETVGNPCDETDNSDVEGRLRMDVLYPASPFDLLRVLSGCGNRGEPNNELEHDDVADQFI